MTDVPPTRLWRTLGRRELESLPEVAQDLAGFLCSRLVPTSDTQRAILDQVLRGDHLQAGLRLAVELRSWGRSRDLALTATLMSALAGLA